MNAQHRPTRSRSYAELLHMSESFLRKREFSSCYKCAMKAQESDPDHPAAAQLIAISIILLKNRSSIRPDWYKILSLKPSNVDQSVIQNRFDVLRNLLNPLENRYPFADEALACVVKAGSVLCDPIRRAYFDNNGETFWTKCPFCCYLYEYERLYEDRFMKCQNVNCRRAYTALPVEEMEVKKVEETEVKKGEYVRTGPNPVGSEEWSGYKDENSKHHVSQTNTGVGSANGGAQDYEKNGVFIDISDNEDEIEGGGAFGSQDKNLKEKVNNGGTFETKRRKVKARSTKKVMGRGVRVNTDDVLMKQQKHEDLEMEQEKKVDGDEHIGASSNKRNLEGDVKLNFSEGEDDIFVGLDADFWKC